MSYLITNEQTDQGSSGEIIFALDSHGNFTYLNRAGEQVSGYSCAEARGMNVAEVVAPEFVAYVREQLSRPFGRCYGLVYELEILTKDGRRVALELSTQPALASDGCFGIQGIAVPAKDKVEGSRSSWGIRCVDQHFVFSV